MEVMIAMKGMASDNDNDCGWGKSILKTHEVAASSPLKCNGKMETLK